MSDSTEITDQEFVENIVKAIVDHPEEVVTGRTQDERGVLIQLTVNREDMGKVIGREGRTAKAIRSLLRVFGARNESRINLKIVDPEGETVAVPEDQAPTTSSERSEVSPTTLPDVKDKGNEIAEPAVAAKPAQEKATGVI